MTAKPFFLKLLGTPEINWQGKVVAIPRRQARALLYRLAVDLEPVARPALSLLFWPESPEKTARRNLTRLLNSLRSELPDAHILLNAQTGIALNPDLAGSDVREFADLRSTNDPPAWETAEKLVRGHFLDGFALPDNVEFDSWLSAGQQQQESAYLDLLSRLVAEKRKAGDLQAAIHYAQQYLQIDDLVEDIHRRLITLYAQSGQRSAALRQYESCMVVLERELGVDPLPETRAAYEAARDGEQAQPFAAPAAPTWKTLPGLDLPLLGREEALGKLGQAFRQVAHGGVILISGAAGVGKSRLMQEFATAQKRLILTGHAYPDEQTLPYQPLMQALRQALFLREQWLEAAPIWIAELSRLLPELPDHFPNLPPPVDIDPQLAQGRLYEALLRLLRVLAANSPLLLCLDDVHWADEATKGWLQYAGGRLAGSGICIMATYRSDEAATLVSWRREVTRRGLLYEVPLAGLGDEAVTDLLKATAVPIHGPDQLARRIQEVTGGNAFFVLETLRELMESGRLADPPAHLPLAATVREAVLRRAERLSALARQVLEVTTVLSPSLDLTVISRTAGRDEMETAAAIDELVLHQQLAGEARLRFQHALARDAIYDAVSPWRRELLHLRAAKALQNVVGRDKSALAIIAGHFEAACDWLRAVKYYRRGAEAAAQLYAHQEAITLLERALEVADESGQETAVLGSLYEALAGNLAVAGEFHKAEQAYHSALKMTPESEWLNRAGLQGKIAKTLVPQQRLDEAEKLLLGVLDSLDKKAPSEPDKEMLKLRLVLLLALQDAQYFQLSPGKMAGFEEEIEGLLEAVGTAEQRVQHYDRLSQKALLENRFRATAENVQLAQKGLVLAYESGDRHLIAKEKFHVGFLMLWSKNPSAAAEELQQSFSRAEELGDFWLQNQSLVYLMVCWRFIGGVPCVRQHLPKLHEISTQVGSGNYIGAAQAMEAWLHFRAGQWAQAQTAAEQALGTWKETKYPFQWQANWLLLALALGQDRLPAGSQAARAMVGPRQQRLPDELDLALLESINAWDAGDASRTRTWLETAVDLATQQGYL